MSTGYSNRVITLLFPDLTDDPANDPIRVVIRNPRLMAPGELSPREIALDENGRPVSEAEASNATYEIMARLVVGWRVYDATAPIELDINGNVVGDQPLLDQVFTADTIAKLPIDIIRRIGEEMAESVNPQ